ARAGKQQLVRVCPSSTEIESSPIIISRMTRSAPETACARECQMRFSHRLLSKSNNRVEGAERTAISMSERPDWFPFVVSQNERVLAFHNLTGQNHVRSILFHL